MKNAIVLFVVLVTLFAWSGCEPDDQSRNATLQQGESQQVFGPEEISFANCLAVISNAQKFILPIPAMAGEPLVYPQGVTKTSGTGKRQTENVAGQPILDWEGKPIAEEGVVFFNAKDQSWQAVASDGQGVVIMNQVTEDQSKKLIAKVQQLAVDPNQLNLMQIKELLKYAQDELGINDMYNSNKEFIKSKMRPLESADSGVEAFGLYCRDDRDVCRAIFIEGQGEFRGPAASGQKFSDGAVIVQQGDSTRLIQPDIFAKTYTHPDGKPLDVTHIPKFVPEKATRKRYE